MSLRTFKKLSKKIISNTKPLIFLVIFTYIIVQPTQFIVYNNTPNTEIVRAAYEQLLQESMKRSDGSINFEALIVGENGDTAINYIITPGDTLTIIARNFGTSVEAIMEANNIVDSNKVRPGQRLKIVYDDGVIVHVKNETTVKEFTRNFQIDQQEFMSMNYLEDENGTMEAGWQVFVPLNQLEAERRGLIEKEEFVMLNLSKPEAPIDEIIQEQQIIIDQANDESDAAESEEYQAYQQVVITAEQTQQNIESLLKQEEQAKIAAEKAKVAAEEARIAAEEAKIRAEQEKTQAAERAAEQARIAAEEAKTRAENEARNAQKRQEAAQQAQQAQQGQNQVVECGENQCSFNGKCWKQPDNAYCIQDDPGHAWYCKEGFTESQGKCVPKNQAQPQPISVASPGSIGTVLEQWYFNPHKVDSNVSGWGPGHCTAMAAYLWSQNYGIRIRDHRTGNAKDWLRNARNAGFTVNNTPAPGALMVSGSGYGARGPYGHVMYVESVDRNAGTVVVIDMNYKGRYITTKRVEAISKAGGFIHPQ